MGLLETLQTMKVGDLNDFFMVLFYISSIVMKGVRISADLCSFWDCFMKGFKI